MDEDFSTEDDGFLAPGQKVPEPEAEDDIDEEPEPLEGKDRDLALDLLVNQSHYRSTTVFGHQVRLRTLTMDDELQVGREINEFEGMRAFEKAYKTAMVAAALEELDGDPLWIPAHPSQQDTHVHHKFEILKHYNPIFIDQVYKVFRDLEFELAPLLERIKKA